MNGVVNGKESIDDCITNIFSDSGSTRPAGAASYSDSLSTTDMITITTLLQQYWNSGDNSKSSAEMNTINNANQMLGSKASEEEQPGSTMNSTENSQESNTTNNNDTFKGIWDTLNSVFTTIVGLQGRTY